MRAWLCMTLALGVLLAAASPALADLGLLVADGVRGPYRISVLASPVPLRAVATINEVRGPAEIRRAALSDGMMSLRESAIKKMAQGITSFEEVLRVTASIEK